MKNIIYGINAILMFMICWFEYKSDSDKIIAFAGLAFVALVFINLLLAVFSQFEGKPVCRHYYISAAALVSLVTIGGFIFVFGEI
ncbi:MAG: hypothetical protein QM762_19055 [Chryseolinea sp.]